VSSFRGEPYTKHTQQMYRKIIRKYLEFIGERSIAIVRHTEIRQYIAHASECGASLNAVYRELGVLRLFYDFLNLGGVVSYVAPRFVRLRRPLGNSRRPLSESQIHRVISAARTSRERALVEFFYATGCRLGEVRRLKIENLDFPSRSAQVRGKLGKIRTVLFTETASDALRSYIAGRKGGFIFQEDLPVQKGSLFVHYGRWMSKWTDYRTRNGIPSQKSRSLGDVKQLSYEAAKKKHGELMASLDLVRPSRNRPLSAVAIQMVIARIARRAGLKNVTPHTFRRTFATHLYDHGASVEVIKALMGHVWIHTTMIYVRIGPDRLAKVFNQCHPREHLDVQQASN
jgi:integrase/recombinase XerD